MKKSLIPIVALILGFPCVAGASDYFYRQMNNQANYVKVEGMKDKEAKEIGLSMPHTFTEEQMIDILRTLRYSRRALFSDKEKIRNVFELEYIDKYAPYLVEAFAKAKPNQVVVWSVVQKRPLVVLRNDRLTQVRMYVAGNELYMDFIKTEAQLQGDYQAQTVGDRNIEQAKGLRILLDPQKGQKFGLNSTDVLILDLSTDFATLADEIIAADLAQEEEEKSRKNKKRTQKMEAKAPGSGAAAAPVTAAPPPASAPQSDKDLKNAEQRLQELKRLEEKGLISKEDYNKKKEEILQGM